MKQAKHIVMLVVLLGAMCASANKACAGEMDSRPIGSQPGQKDDDKSYLDGWPRVVASLAVVAALVYLARWLLKKAGASGRLVPSRGQDVLEVISRCPVSMKHQVYLVRLGRRLLVLGAGQQGLSTLAEITDPQEAAELIELADGAKADSFRSMLASKADQLKAAEAAAAGGRNPPAQDASGEAVRQLKQKLQARMNDQNQGKNE